MRFNEKDGAMIATAVDLLQISNPYLGYDILYLLNNLKIQADGSVEYLGRAQFIDKLNESNRREIEEVRYETYLNSPKYFFKSLIDNKLEANRFVAELVNYEDGDFVFSKEFVLSESLRGPSDFNKYTIEFDGFLKVYNENSKSISFNDTGVRQGGLESSRFSASGRQEKAITEFNISFLFKVSPYIILNEYGNVLNTKDVKEYGYWANQRVANQLPFDYGNDYYKNDAFPVNSIAEESNPDTLSNANIFSLLKSLIYEKSINVKHKQLETLSEHWEDGFVPPLVEILRMSTDQALIDQVLLLLKKHYPESDNPDFFEWVQWLWKNEMPEEDYHYKFKAEVYKHIDPQFENYFKDRAHSAQIRLDEILWGGVQQDGIPPLRHPTMLKAEKATYLSDTDVVFGLFINGEARAYPKRILAWHEFFTDSMSGYDIAGVYCTLCGTVIIYDQKFNGTTHNLGTSGFLYRSNKLMYDERTQSLWSTIEGRPVLGPLVDQEISLRTFPVVTTDWKSWREKHPETMVLDINTGYDRNYDEGEAYKQYFSHDELMFPVIAVNDQLKNKDEVVIVRLPGYKNDPLAVSVKYLKRKKWFQGSIAGHTFVLLGGKSGAARAYAADGKAFKSYAKGVLIDNQNVTWEVKEAYLVNHAGEKLNRLPAHNIFWFAWYNLFPRTRLVK